MRTIHAAAFAAKEGNPLFRLLVGVAVATWLAAGAGQSAGQVVASTYLGADQEGAPLTPAGAVCALTASGDVYSNWSGAYFVTCNLFAQAGRPPKTIAGGVLSKGSGLAVTSDGDVYVSTLSLCNWSYTGNLFSSAGSPVEQVVVVGPGPGGSSAVVTATGDVFVGTSACDGNTNSNYAWEPGEWCFGGNVFGPSPTPARRATWGEVHELYRH